MSVKRDNIVETLKTVDHTFSDRKPSMDVWNAFITFLHINEESDDAIELYKGGDLDMFWAVAFMDVPEPEEKVFRNGSEMLDFVSTMKFKRFKKEDVKEKENVRKPVVNKDFNVSHASGLNKSLTGRDDAVALWGALCGVSADWPMERFVLAMTQVMKAMQGTFEGKLGVLEEITQEQYESWLERATGAQVSVGPFMLIKLALQNGAYLSICGDVQKMARNGVELELDDVYVLKGDKEKFATGITYKGKTVGYSHVDKEAYALFDYIGRTYDVVRVGQKNPKLAFVQHTADQVSKYKYSGSVGFKHKAEVDDAIKGIVNSFNNENVVEKDADMIIDRIAHMIQRILTPNIKEAVASFKRTAFAQVKKFEVVLQKAASMTPEDAKTELNKITPHPTVKAAHAYCEAMREARNRTDISQYSLKNSGSYQGSVSVPAIDTILKGARIRDYMDNNGLTGIEKKCMYGIAYGHMIEPLMKDDLHIQLFDINPAKNSPYQIAEGNIFYADHEGALIIDDTNTGKNIGEKHMKEHARVLRMDGVPKPMSGDEFKVMRFAEKLTTCTIISKVTMGNVDKLLPILFPTKREQPFAFVRVVKFGKLHNPEVFLILSNKKELGGKTPNFFAGDARVCASVSSLANSILMELHTRGIGVGSLHRGLMSSTWESIMKAMPRTWPWYKRVFAKEIVLNKTINEMEIGIDYGDEEREVWDDQHEHVTYDDFAEYKEEKQPRRVDVPRDKVNSGSKLDSSVFQVEKPLNMPTLGDMFDLDKMEQLNPTGFRANVKQLKRQLEKNPRVPCIQNVGGTDFYLAHSRSAPEGEMHWYIRDNLPDDHVLITKEKGDRDPLLFDEDDYDDY